MPLLMLLYFINITGLLNGTLSSWLTKYIICHILYLFLLQGTMMLYHNQRRSELLNWKTTRADQSVSHSTGLLPHSHCFLGFQCSPATGAQAGDTPFLLDGKPHLTDITEHIRDEFWRKAKNQLISSQGSARLACLQETPGCMQQLWCE